MDEDPLARFDRAVALAHGVISAVRAEQLGDPTPCSEWSVRQVINHVVAQTLLFASMVTAGRHPDPDQDHLGGDPLAAFRDGADRLRGAFSRPGVVAGGEGPGLWTLNLSVIELTVHSWDIARATGQRTDFDPGLAHWVLGVLREGLPPDRRGGPFGVEQPAPAYLPIVERMAAFAGRTAG
jgi:uncharacterized protein (TIGR03086 family)